MHNKKILALIPARGGSKGIKNKNIIELAGKPLISYVIEALKQAETVDKIICTTDSETIAKVANKYGAETPFLRPAEMAQDNSPTYPAIVHTVETMEKLQNFKADYIITAQPTYPLLQSEHIDDAVKLAIEKNADSVITACSLEHDCHPYNIREQNEDGIVKFWKDDEHYQFPTRQSKPKFFTFGNVFVTSYDTVIEKGKLEGEINYLIEIDRMYHLDINTKQDIFEIEYIIKNKLY